MLVLLMFPLFSFSFETPHYRLSCLLTGDTALERCIDATVEAMEKRLDATQELINIHQKLELVDQNSQSQYG